MATFMTRVELHDANEEDYEKLHKAMEDQGFTRTITSGKGVVHHLPTAEYRREADLTREEILDSAKVAAATTGKDYGAIVTESDGIRWFGLKKAS